MRDSVGTGFYCYHAVEAMMHAMRPNQDGQANAADWARFRDALRLDRSALDFVKSHADVARHAKANQITDEDRAKVFVITDKIIRRYLEFMMGGRNPLPEAQFEILRG